MKGHRSEYEEQVAVFRWAHFYESKWPCLKLLFGSIMGIYLPIKYLNKLKKAGMKKGKPDINLPVPRGGYCGMWIELKAIGGKKPTAEQVATLEHLAAEGNACFTCYGADAAMLIIKAYLSGEIKKEDENNEN